MIRYWRVLGDVKLYFLQVYAHSAECLKIYAIYARVHFSKRKRFANADKLFANNVAKFVLSIGPQTTKEKGAFQIDLEDDAVQNMLISFNGEARWPDKVRVNQLGFIQCLFARTNPKRIIMVKSIENPTRSLTNIF